MPTPTLLWRNHGRDWVIEFLDEASYKNYYLISPSANIFSPFSSLKPIYFTGTKTQHRTSDSPTIVQYTAWRSLTAMHAVGFSNRTHFWDLAHHRNEYLRPDSKICNLVAKTPTKHQILFRNIFFINFCQLWAQIWVLHAAVLTLESWIHPTTLAWNCNVQNWST